MEASNIIGTTIVFDDAYTGTEKFGRIDRVFGDDAIVRVISREEAGSSPRRVKLKPDARIAAITDNSGLVN
ncbi:MAG TPA: hypothetical protein VGG45_20620 [Terracidiphilus sp.]|jgi:hypothetical protein